MSQSGKATHQQVGQGPGLHPHLPQHEAKARQQGCQPVKCGRSGELLIRNKIHKVVVQSPLPIRRGLQQILWDFPCPPAERVDVEGIRFDGSVGP